MFEDYIKLLNEIKKINRKIDKGYKKIIISIVIMALGFALPGFLTSEVPFLMNLSKAIDAIYMSITNTKNLITPLLYMGMCLLGSVGTIVNTIRVLVQKNKLHEVEYEEKEKLLEIKAKIEELTNENQVVKEQVVELNKSKKQLLKGLKKDIKEKFTLKKIKNNNKSAEIIAEVTDNIKETDEVKVKQK